MWEWESITSEQPSFISGFCGVAYGHGVGSLTTQKIVRQLAGCNTNYNTLSVIAANRAITIRDQAFFDVRIWTSDKESTALSGSKIYPLVRLPPPLPGLATMWKLRGQSPG